MHDAAQDRLIAELRQLGPEGERAAEMLGSAAEQIELRGIRCGNLIAYAVREALMSLLDLAGKPERRVSDAADRVIEIAGGLDDAAASRESLLEAIGDLAAARKGVGPHIARLEALIGMLARNTPVRAKADLLDAYNELIGEVNALHADVSLDEARELHARAVTTLGRLFGPMSVRLEEIEPVARVVEPSDEDVERLAALAGDPRTLSYFFKRIEGPAWLRALADHSLLQPPAQGPWFAYSYLLRLAQSDPDAVRDWLASRPSGHELADHQTRLLIAVARSVGEPIAEAVLQITKGRTGDSGVLHQVVGYLGELQAERHVDGAVISLVKRALEGVTAQDSPADDSYLAAALLRVAVSSARQGEARRWLGVLTAKLRAACERYPRDVRVLQPISGLTGSADDGVLEQLVAAVRDVAHLAADQDVLPNERVARLATLPAPVAGRMIAAHLVETVDVDAAIALSELTREVADQDSMPETLALLGELTQREYPDLEQRMLDALGDPPSSEEVAALGQGEEFPRSWTHAFGWLMAMPAAVKEAWALANEKVEATWGTASLNGHLWPKPIVRPAPPRKALDTDALAELEPIEAAESIAAWTPTGEFGDATRYDAVRELEQLIEGNLPRWLPQPPAPIIDALATPMYAEHYLRALAGHVNQLGDRVPEILDAVELAERKLDDAPPTEPEDGDAIGWVNVVSVGVDLISKLAAVGAPMGANTNRGWELIERAVRRRDELFEMGSDSKPLERAVYRPSMRALNDAIVYADATSDDGVEPQRLLALLDEALTLDRPDGLHARAVIGRALAWLAWHAPAWTEDRWDTLVGTAAPDDLGSPTFGVHLEWGATSELLLSAHRDLYFAALDTSANVVGRHILHGMLWRLDGYDPATVARAFAEAGDDQVAEAIHWLAFGAREADDMPLEQAIEFIRQALEGDLPPETFKALGWLSRIERLDDEIWLDVTLSAIEAAHGDLEQPDDVAERAAKHLGDERAIRIVASLLGADIPLWHLEAVGEAGLQLARGNDAPTRAAREELREQLLKREFFDAQNGASGSNA